MEDKTESVFDIHDHNPIEVVFPLPEKWCAKSMDMGTEALAAFLYMVNASVSDQVICRSALKLFGVCFGSDSDYGRGYFESFVVRVWIPHKLQVIRAYNEALLAWDTLELNQFMPFRHNILAHDISKLTMAESDAAIQFGMAACTPGYKPDLTKINFNTHYAHNPHHWNAWNGAKMPDRYIGEMVIDWLAASRQHGDGDVGTWFESNYPKMNLHPYVVEAVDKLLSKI